MLTIFGILIGWPVVFGAGLVVGWFFLPVPGFIKTIAAKLGLIKT